MKVVLDSNVIVSAFATRGLCASLFEILLASEEIIISEHILYEVKRVLRIKIKLPEKNTSEIIDYLRESCSVLDYNKLISNVCRDKDDDKILALAFSNGIKLIVTGDKDILSLKKYKTIKILSPKEYWKTFLS